MNVLLPINDDGPGQRFAQYRDDSAMFVPSCGWHVWDGASWLLDCWDWRAILGQPARFLADFKDAIAECCRQNWVHKDRQLFPMGVHYQYAQAVCTGVDVKRNGLNTRTHVARVACRGAFKQHVSFPTLNICLRVGQIGRLPARFLGHDLFPLVGGAA